MIDTDNTFGITTIYCDGENCDEEFEHEGFDGHCYIKGAVEDAKEYGWIQKYVNGGYEHYCPNCKGE